MVTVNVRPGFLEFLNGDPLSHLQAFELDFGSEIAGLDNPDLEWSVVSLASDEIVISGGGALVPESYTVTFSGSGIAPVGSIEELLAAIQNGVATGTLDTISVEAGSSEILAIDLDPDAFSVTSGDQSLVLEGGFPTSLEEISDFLGALEILQQLPFVAPEDLDDALAVLASYELSAVALSDDGNELLSMALGADQLSVSISGYALTLEGSFPANMAELLVTLGTFVNSGFDPTVLAVLADEYGFEITGGNFAGPDGVLVSVNGNLLGVTSLDDILWRFTGTDGDDRLEDLGFGGDDEFWAGAGNDTVLGGAGNDTIGAGTGNDEVWAGTGDDLVMSGGGNDTVGTGTGNDEVWAGTGDDLVMSGGGNDTVGGGAGHDALWAGAGNDTVYGGAGNDTIGGGANDDELWGGDGNDTVYGGDGADMIGGGSGDDELWGSDGNDTVYGGDGADMIGGGSGDDELWGSDGNDTVYGGDGADTLGGGTGDDALWSGGGNDTILGGSGNDTLGGGDGADALYADIGNDLLRGGTGADTLFGGDDDDTLIGGPGDDILWGGTGADTFVFAAGDGDDRVRDFDAGAGDMLRLDSGLWSGTLTAQEVVDAHATVSGGTAVLEFDDGTRITLQGFADLDALEGAISIA